MSKFALSLAHSFLKDEEKFSEKEGKDMSTETLNKLIEMKVIKRTKRICEIHDLIIKTASNFCAEKSLNNPFEIGAEAPSNKESLKDMKFLTINPDPKSQDVKKLIPAVADIINRSFFDKTDDTKIIFEQRSEDIDNIEGVHIHILGKMKGTPGNVGRDCLSTLEGKIHKLSGTTNVKSVSTQLHYDRLNNEYTNGIKKEEKMKKVNIDKQWRQREGLKDIYTWSEFMEMNSQGVLQVSTNPPKFNILTGSIIQP